MPGAELGAELDLHPRAINDFFDSLVAMKFLDREGDGPEAKYSNTPAGALYLDSNSPRYVGGILVMLNERLFSTGTISPKRSAPANLKMKRNMAKKASSKNSTKNCPGSNSSWEP